ncbi:MAG: hypothetical protein NXI16_05365 [Alphaproteobacteria bacterium]|nr:hypothetical protein [Alphaproteobacteria bacterium]
MGKTDLLDALGDMHDAVGRVWDMVYNHALGLKQSRSPIDNLAKWADRAQVSKGTLTRVLDGQRPKADTLEKLARAIIHPDQEDNIVGMENDVLAFEDGMAALPQHPIVKSVVDVFVAQNAVIDYAESVPHWKVSGAYDRMTVSRVNADRTEIENLHRGVDLRFRVLGPPKCQVTKLQFWRRRNFERGLRSLESGRPQFLFQEMFILENDDLDSFENLVSTMAFESHDMGTVFITVSERRKPQ